MDKEIKKIILLIVNDIPSGREALITKMLGWKELYKRRPSMIDELNKVLYEIYALMSHGVVRIFLREFLQQRVLA